MAKWSEGNWSAAQRCCRAFTVGLTDLSCEKHYRLLLLALIGAMGLGGCSSVPLQSQVADGQAPVNGASGCYAPQPNTRAAYNRTYTVLGRSYTPLRSSTGYEAQGTASWYGWESGTTTSMGVRFNPRAFTAASRTLPLPTCVQVTNLANGRSALVLVNDRGPFVDSRIMDLSYGAAQALGITRTGTAQVRIVALAGNTPPLNPVPASGAPVEAAMPRASATPMLGSTALPEQFATAPPQPQAAATQVDRTGVVDGPGIVVLPLPPAQTATAAGPASQLAASAPITRVATLQPPQQTQTQAQPPMQPTMPASAPEMLAPQMPGSSQTYVQTGAFAVQANAQTERARLMAAGIGPVDIVPGYIHGVDIYRVQIGPLPNGQPDTDLQRRLGSLGLSSYTLVQQ
jgi:rare lipoprotein A